MLERFSNDCQKTKTKAVTPANHDRGKQRNEPITIPSNYLKLAQSAGKSRVHGAIGFGFASHWLKNWRESFKPITKRSNRNHVFTFDSHLKTAQILKFHLPNPCRAMYSLEDNLQSFSIILH